MSEVIVVGLGSPHGADRAGWQAIDALQNARLADRFAAGQVTLSRCATPVELYPLLEHCRFAILIDALPARPGRLLWIRPQDLDRPHDLSSVHGFGAGEMLALLEALAERPPQLAILGIGVDIDSAASPLDAPSAPALCCLRKEVEQAIRRYLAGAGHRQKTLSAPA